MIRRFASREVKIGSVGIGGNNPIRIQSMTNTDTLDTLTTVDQIMRLADSGCELVRLAVQGRREAYNLEKIKNELLKKNYSLPLIADVHFNPQVALIAARTVEKVRINPGNYSDRNTGKTHFTEQEYSDSLHRIQERLSPLIELCIQHGTALRIGANSGSLSERIIARYGNTPMALVESVLEFARICKAMDFHHIVLSIKASHVRTMVYSNRLLIKKMIAEGMDYPVHLGVTEAGDSQDGIIKSAVGIGTLLADGIGDTIRISLTGDPLEEIPVAKQIVSYFDAITDKYSFASPGYYDQLPVDYLPSERHLEIAGQKIRFPLVVQSIRDEKGIKPDIIARDDDFLKISKPGSLKKSQISGYSPLVLESDGLYGMVDFRALLNEYRQLTLRNPVILKKQYTEKDYSLRASLDFGPFFVDALADGLWIDHQGIPSGEVIDFSLRLLQATGARVSHTEYISCPSCGRTQFDISAALSQVKEKTRHLKGLKIAVMGCIVNGPGEMADADYGIIGMGNGKVAIYKGKQPIKKGLDADLAADELIGLIKAFGDWRENQ